MSSGPKSRPPNYYEILQLPQNPTTPHPLAKEDVKAAYHRALLRHHPDKAATIAQLGTHEASPYLSIDLDTIVTAYETLSSPAKRRAYDAALAAGVTSTTAKGTHPGVETFDLEDLVFDEQANTWHQQCRCGNEEGYVLSEEELERESRQGEIYVGCRGCSLFVKVVFGVAEEGEGTAQP